MRFRFLNLDEQTRAFMVEEVNDAIKHGRLHFGRLNAQGRSAWPSLLLEAAQTHDEQWLAQQLQRGQLLVTSELHQTSRGRKWRAVPNNSPSVLAEGEFNRFYMLGVCRRALAQGQEHVIIYRAKPVNEPRAASRFLQNSAMSAPNALDALRLPERGPKFLLGKPGSGLSVHLASPTP